VPSASTIASAATIAVSSESCAKSTVGILPSITSAAIGAAAMSSAVTPTYIGSEPDCVAAVTRLDADMTAS